MKNDLLCHDLSDSQIINIIGEDISRQVNPFTLERWNPFFGKQKTWKISEEECVKLLFDEFRALSSLFSFYRPYKSVIKKMITHMQFRKGAPFSDPLLDNAMHHQIVEDTSTKSSLFWIKKQLSELRSQTPLPSPSNIAKEINTRISDNSRVPIFNRLEDNVNGLGITVHDTWSTKITLRELDISTGSYSAIVDYDIEDHFGLDDEDIAKSKFKKWRIFRLWYFLQRSNRRYGTPFKTKMKASIPIQYTPFYLSQKGIHR